MNTQPSTFILDNKTATQLTIIANPQAKRKRLILVTQDPDVFKKLPSRAAFSLVTQAEKSVQLYLNKLQQIREPAVLTQVQQEKERLALKTLEQLRLLHQEERDIEAGNTAKQEILRSKVIEILQDARDENLLITNTFATGEGELGDTLYDAIVKANDFAFNQAYAISHADQLLFSEDKSVQKNYIWDSDYHLSEDPAECEIVLTTLATHYNLTRDDTPRSTPRNRWARLESSLIQNLKDARSAMNKLAEPHVWLDTEKGFSFGKEPAVENPTTSALFNALNSGQEQTYIWDRAKIRWKQFKSLFSFSDKHVINQVVKEHVHTENEQFCHFENFIKAISKFKEVSLEQSQITAIVLEMKDISLSSLLEENFRKIKENNGEDWWELLRFKVREIFNKNKIPLERYDILDIAIPSWINIEEELEAIGHGIDKIKTLIRDSRQENNALNEYSIHQQYQAAIPEHQAVQYEWNNPLHVVLDELKGLHNTLTHYGEKNPITTTTAFSVFGFALASVFTPLQLSLLLKKLSASKLQPAAGFANHSVISMLGKNPIWELTGSLFYLAGVIELADFDKALTHILENFKKAPVDLLVAGGVNFLAFYTLGLFIPFFRNSLSISTMLTHIMTADSVHTRYTKGEASSMTSRLWGWVSVHFLPAFLALSPSHFFNLNKFFNFGVTLFKKEGYDFLPEFAKLEGSAANIAYGIFKNAFLAIPYALTFVTKFIALISSPFLPLPIVQFSFALFKRKIRDAVGALTDFTLSLFQFVLGDLPTYLHIVYRGVTKLIAKTLGTLAEPGKMAEVLWAAAKRPGIMGFFVGDLHCRFSVNYGFGSFKDPSVLYNPLDYLKMDGVFGTLKGFLFCVGALVLDVLIITKDLVRNPLLLISDFLIFPTIRILGFSLDLGLRTLCAVSAFAFKALDFVLNTPNYFLQKPTPYTFGGLIKLGTKGFIKGIQSIDKIASIIKRTIVSPLNRLKIAARLFFFPTNDPPEKQSFARAEKQAVNILGALQVAPSKLGLDDNAELEDKEELNKFVKGLAFFAYSPPQDRKEETIPQAIQNANLSS